VDITVRLFDANGHPLTTSRGSIVLSTSLGTLADLTDHNDGTWSATLTSLAVGTAAVTGLLDGAPIADTATVTFVAGPASPLTSTITADPPRTRIGGKGTAIRVRLFDAQGNRLTGSGGTVTLATTLGMLGAVEDRGDGSYRATLQSGVVGRALVTGSVNGVPMTAAVEVRFVD
jgi:adhesin/invasin